MIFPVSSLLEHVNLRLILLGGICILISACSNKQSNQAQSGGYSIAKTDNQLVNKYCGSCHLPPSADLLDKKTWVNSVLPIMAHKLGVQSIRGNQYYLDPDAKVTHKISLTKWMKIVKYFKNEAPDSLEPATPPVPLSKDWSIFKLKSPPQKKISKNPSATFMVKMDTADGRIYTSDASTNKLYEWDRNLNRKLVRSLSSPAVNLKFVSGKENRRYGVITTIGTTRAADIFKGKVFRLNLDTLNKDEADTIATQMDRPVMSVDGDFNKDGRKDWVVCAFGHDAGGLFLFEQNADHTYTKKAISGLPGAIDVKVDDFNNDGWPDLMVLFAYADEGIWLFTNNKHGGFDSRNLLEFPPVYGSTSFQLVDMNNDGLLDILYTNGDNADFSRILKPYHGVRIFLNEGDFHYKKAYFYPIDGTTKAIAKDFDGDGDLDIATISFFSDFKNKPSESFIYFEQTGPLTFTPHALPIYKKGRWLTMDAGDIDDDGDLDIALGSFTQNYVRQSSYPSEWGASSPLVILLNTTK